MKKIVTMFALCTLFLVGSAMALDNKSHDHSKHGEKATMDKATTGKAKMDTMDHSNMKHGFSMEDGTFKHAVMTDGIHAEFQVMELAAMNMTDPEGRTHHVMASFMKDDKKIDKAVGRVKVIAPSGKEQIADLKDYGSGVFAANITIDESGKWGVICLFKDSDGKHTAKFWYQHKMK